MGRYATHKDYKTCLRCGANLDHGESCDCHREDATLASLISEWRERQNRSNAHDHHTS